MKGSEDILAKKTTLHWEPTQCSTFTGRVQVKDLLSECNKKRKAGWDTLPIASGRWKFRITIAETPETCDWISIYLLDTKSHGSHTICPQMELALHAETRNLAACEVRGTPPANMDASQPCLGEKKFCQISVIRHCEELKKKDAILLDYVIHEYPYDFGTWALDLPPPFKGIWDAMVSLFDDSSTADVRFIIRHSTRSDDRARQIYAHSKVLSSRCDYFKTLFQSGFSENESGSVDITAFEEHQWEQTSDSDFEDSEEDSNDLADGTSRPESEDGEGAVAGKNRTGLHREWRVNKEVNFHYHAAQVSQRKCRNIFILDSSYRTYRALLYYLYSGCIALAPPRALYDSERTKASVAASDYEFPSRNTYNDQHAIRNHAGDGTVRSEWASAKSMYKLCDKLGIMDLKAAAAKFIHESLTPDTVLHELRSSFSSLFPEIMKDQDVYLKEHWPEVCKTKAFDTFMADLFANCPGESGKILFRHMMAAVRGPDPRPAPTSPVESHL